MTYWQVLGPNPAYRTVPNRDAPVVGRLGQGAIIQGERIAGDTHGWIAFRFWKFRRPCYVWGGLAVIYTYDNEITIPAR